MDDFVKRNMATLMTWRVSNAELEDIRDLTSRVILFRDRPAIDRAADIVCRFKRLSSNARQAFIHASSGSPNEEGLVNAMTIVYDRNIALGLRQGFFEFVTDCLMPRAFRSSDAKELSESTETDRDTASKQRTDRLVVRMSCLLTHKHADQFLEHIDVMRDRLEEAGETEKTIRRFCFWQILRYAGIIRWAMVIGCLNGVWQFIRSSLL